jgi:NAD(P)H-dependent flavin oxidoreductase YrpB (nitropropane dioxygenase family)
MGRLARVVRNTFTDSYAKSIAPVLPFFWQHYAALDIFDEADRQGNTEYRPLWSGQGVGRLHDLPSAGEVVAKVVSEARALLLKELPQVVWLER